MYVRYANLNNFQNFLLFIGIQYASNINILIAYAILNIKNIVHILLYQRLQKIPGTNVVGFLSTSGGLSDQTRVESLFYKLSI